MQQPPSKRPPPPTAVQSALTNLLAGTAGGVAVTIVGHPLDTIKTLLQNQPPASGTKMEAKTLLQNKPPASAANPQRYSGLVDCARQVWRAEGLSGLYKGVASPLAFQMLFRAVTFMVFDLTQTAIVALREPSAPPHPPGTGAGTGTSTSTARGAKTTTTERVCLSPTEAFAAGAVTGLFGSLVESPIDLLKTKMQIQMMRDHQGKEKGTRTGAWTGSGTGAGTGAGTGTGARTAGAAGAATTHAQHTTQRGASSVRYRGIFDAAFRIIRERGVRGIYQGLGATWLRNIPAQVHVSYTLLFVYTSTR